MNSLHDGITLAWALFKIVKHLGVTHEVSFILPFIIVYSNTFESR